MPNPLFENQGQSSPVKGGGIFGLLFNRMYQGNPQFRDFANSVKGKTPEQAFREHGLDYSKYAGMSEDDKAKFLSDRGML